MSSTDIHSGSPPVWCYGCNKYVAKYEKFPFVGGKVYRCPHCGHNHKIKGDRSGGNNKTR